MSAKAILARILMMVPILLVVSFAVFCLILLVPGDPAVTLAGNNPTPEDIARVREATGLDKPFLTQYADWVSGMVRGDFGESLFSGQPVRNSISARLPTTASLALITLVFAATVGVGSGVVAALRPGRIVDRTVSALVTLGVATPPFWLGMLLVVAFAIHFRWFPAVGFTPLTEDPVEWLRHLILPAIALGASSAAEIARQTRAAMVRVLDEDYIRTAMAKGLTPRQVVGKHALKNAAIPAITVIGLQAGRLVGGSVVTERVFAMPGIGSYAYNAVTQRDLRAVQGVVVVAVVLVLVINLIVDLSYSYFNPRLRQR